MSLLSMTSGARRSGERSEREGSLVQRAIDGDREAFGGLYERHVDRVFNYVRFRVGDTAVARDLTQDVFVSAFRSVEQLRRVDRFEAWLLRIAHNRVLNHHRSQSRRLPLTVLDGGAASVNPMDLAGTNEAIGAAERCVDAEVVVAAVVTLTELQQQVLALRFVGGLTLAETARALGRSEDAVKKLQRRALAALRRTLDSAKDDV